MSEVEKQVTGLEVAHGKICPEHTGKMGVVSSRRETKRITESILESKQRQT